VQLRGTLSALPGGVADAAFAFDVVQVVGGQQN